MAVKYIFPKMTDFSNSSPGFFFGQRLLKNRWIKKSSKAKRGSGKTLPCLRLSEN